jgi:hypothetical protein
MVLIEIKLAKAPKSISIIKVFLLTQIYILKCLFPKIAYISLCFCLINIFL